VTVGASAIETVEVGGQAVPLHYGSPADEFASAHSGVVVIRRSHEGRLRVTGRDRLDLLHRMSTNDVNSLKPGAAQETVLTTPIARIVDLLWVVNRGETGLCLTSPGRATAVRRWLAGYIFYNDKVRFEDVSAELGQLGLFGPRAAEVADAWLPGASALAEDRFVEDGESLVLRGRPLAGGGFTVIAPQAQVESLWERALQAGAAPAGEKAYQWLRIEAGIPAAGHELTDNYIPLEANLWPAVSFTKGCYIGQEIIARMESRGKLARRLAGLRLEAPVAEGVAVRTGEEGPAAGTITSAAELPGYGPVALAFLRTAQADTGTRVRVGEVAGEIVELPFR
jgi:folate-binding protein YgfZ